jgi:hypothetical protein
MGMKISSTSSSFPAVRRATTDLYAETDESEANDIESLEITAFGRRSW